VVDGKKHRQEHRRFDADAQCTRLIHLLKRAAPPKR
jgi:hypothetical protein